MEPSLNPPVDIDMERISEYVGDLTFEDLAIEIYNYGLDEKVKEIILELEIPNANDFVRQVIMDSNLDFLFKLVSKKSIEEVQERLIDKMYCNTCE